MNKTTSNSTKKRKNKSTTNFTTTSNSRRDISRKTGSALQAAKIRDISHPLSLPQAAAGSPKFKGSLIYGKSADSLIGASLIFISYFLFLIYSFSRNAALSIFRHEDKRKKTLISQCLFSTEMRQLPTLPASCPTGTLGSIGLNFCVRNVNRWIPYDMTTAMAPRTGLEPVTIRLTAERSTY